MASIVAVRSRNETEMWIDGHFVASWRYIEIPAESLQILASMIDKAVEYGESKKAEQIRKVIGVTK